MKIDNNTAADIGIALNEATLLGAEYDQTRNIISTTFAVLTLPSDQLPEPFDSRRQLIFTDIGRIAAALRDAYWNDLNAKTVPFHVTDLLSVVQSFGGQPIYGWEFINNDDKTFDYWENDLSLNLIPPNGSFDNRLSLFQERTTAKRHLDLWVWFADLLIRDASGNIISISDFVAGGIRWWDAMYAGDSRTHDHGIFPAGRDR